MKEESIISKKIIRDHILANSVEPHNLEIPNKLIVSCSTENQKCKESLEEAKKQKAINKNEIEKQELAKQPNYSENNLIN